MFIATLAGIFTYKELPEKYSSFVQYKASLEKRKIDENDEIAVLNITGTESYHVLFLKAYNNIQEIKDELKLADAKINHTSLKILEGHL